MLISVHLQPHVSDKKITYTVYGRMYCNREKKFIAKSNTFSIEDIVWLRVFRTKERVDSFYKDGKAIIIEISSSDLGYDKCDENIM